MLFIEDITLQKLKDLENKKILEILNKTNEIARIGAWKRNFVTDTTIWSKIARDIMEDTDDFELDLEFAGKICKEGKSRHLTQRVIKRALEFGEHFDIKVDIITAKGNQKKVRIVGYPEFKNGKCERLMGIFQEEKITPCE